MNRTTSFDNFCSEPRNIWLSGEVIVSQVPIPLALTKACEAGNLALLGDRRYKSHSSDNTFTWPYRHEKHIMSSLKRGKSSFNLFALEM